MSNAEIFGFEEDGWGEIRNGIVHVVKNHRRSARDAAVPPGQAIEFEFYVAQFPFHMGVTHAEDHIGTTERRVPGRETGPLIRDLQRATAAAAMTATAGATAATTPTTPTTPTTFARRRPLDIVDFNGSTLEPPIPDPPQDRVVPFEITLTPPNGLAPLVYTNPWASTISRWPNDTVGASINPSYIQRGKGKWRISVRNTNPIARRMHVHVQSVHALTSIRHEDIPLSLLNRLSAVALAKALPTIEYDRGNGNIVVSTPTHFLDLMGIDRVYSLGSIAAKVIDDLPTFTPLSAKVLSQADFAVRLQQRIVALKAEYEALGSGMQARQGHALKVCQDSLERLQEIPPAHAAFCIVLEGMFTQPNVDLRVIGTVAEIDNRIPQIGLVFDEQFKCGHVITNLAIDLSPLLTKTLLATGVVVALSALATPLLGAFALIGGALLYNSIDIDLEEEIRNKVSDKRDEIAGYVKRALERITDLGASGLHARIHPGAAADGSDNLHIQYFNPSDARPPRPRPPGVDGTFAGGVETMVLATGEGTGRPRRALTNVAHRSPVGLAVSTERAGSAERAALTERDHAHP